MSTSPPPAPTNPLLSDPCSSPSQPRSVTEPVLCVHCGRTATNGISCQGYCVADSGY